MEVGSKLSTIFPPLRVKTRQKTKFLGQWAHIHLSFVKKKLTKLPPESEVEHVVINNITEN